MHNFLYFVAAAVLIAGLLYVSGYIGPAHSRSGYSSTAEMNQMISGATSGGCDSCKWY